MGQQKHESKKQNRNITEQSTSNYNTLIRDKTDKTKQLVRTTYPKRLKRIIRK